ncbi:MFS transporter [Enterococcus sp. AZ149]|uniref:MFS transporter n=1 Tax=Enterococcus sp. AZ149 TaxID=2774686 RepID=UPI003F1F04ED
MEIKHKFQVIYFVQYATMAILMTQIVPFLTEQGYDAFERGWFLASYSITTILFQLVIGYYSDKSKRLKRISLLLMIFLVFFSISFYWLGKDHWLIHFLVLAIAGGLANTTATVLDNWVLSESSTSKRIASIKANGSLGWSMMSVCVPFFLFSNNYRWFSLPLLLFLLINYTFSRTIPEKNALPQKQGTATNSGVSLADILLLCKDRRFLVYTGLFFLLYLTIVANNTVVIDKLITMERGSEFVGLKWSIQSFCEIPAYLLLNRMIAKWKNERLILIAGIFLTLQFFVYWLASSPFLLLAASFLQFFTVPAFTIGSRMIISAITPPAVFSSGQLISISVYIGAASFLSPLAGGFLSQVLSLDTAIFIFGLLPFVAFLIYSSCQRTLSAI